MKKMQINELYFKLSTRWYFLTDDNRIGYVKYIDGILSIQLTVPFNIIVKNTSIKEIISNLCCYYNRYNLKILNFKFISLIIKNIWKYKIRSKRYNVIKTLISLPEIFEFCVNDGIYILYEIIDIDIKKWERIWDILKDIDYMNIIQKVTNGDEEKYYIDTIKRKNKK